HGAHPAGRPRHAAHASDAPSGARAGSGLGPATARRRHGGGRARLGQRPAPAVRLDERAPRGVASPRMLSLLLHAALGALTVGIFFRVNAHLYRRDWAGSRTTWLERLYYVLAVASVCTGWYFNIQYVFTYPAEASWVHFTKMLFATPAGGSGAQDLIVTNAVLFPLWTIVDGSRRGLRGTWNHVTMSQVPRFGF